ncbi:hypothetical protein ACE6H2_009845 [Prunus campanulata]
MPSTPGFNKEVLMDILLRLPPKPLIRFLCACKFWKDLISSSLFVTTHFNLNAIRRGNIFLLCLHHQDFERNFDVDDPSVKKDLQWSLFSNETFEQCFKLKHPLGSTEHYGIYGSSNGVLCISDEILKPKSRIHIWNPTIGKCRTVPLSITDDTKFRYIALQFGFHPEVNDYKVVRMMCTANKAFAVEVYSLATNSWKMIEDVPPWLKCTWEHHQGTFLNGVTYTIIDKCPIITIVSFDSGSEKFEEYVLPDAICGTWGLHIVIYKEQICLLYGNYCCEEEGMDKNDFWVLQKKGWKQLSPFVFSSDRCYSTMGISVDDELLLEKNDFTVGAADLYLCNYESRQIRETGIKLAYMRYGQNELLFAITYVETLGFLDY